MQETLREMIECFNEEALVMDGYDDCIIGVAECFGKSPSVVYDVNKVLEKLMGDGMTHEEALEYYDYNMVGAYVGESTPIFVHLH